METIKALPAWYQDAFVHWYGSVHGKKGVTCDKCHGGQAEQQDKEKAHLGLRPSRDPKSPIYYTNVPETCGSCHEGVYQQFVKSRHYQNLKADRLAPTCTTCHGFQMDIQPVQPLRIAWRCTLCHNPERGIRPEIANLAKEVLERVSQTEHAIHKAQLSIELAREQGLESKKAEKLLEEARQRFAKTGSFWHAFRLKEFEKELMEIREAAGKAMDEALQSFRSK
jgi:formate-dependent nitrite reductase cytochrome c552 subunit